MLDKIIIFGLAGSGKSTLAKSLAREFGLRVVHPSGIMRDLLEGKTLNLQETRHNDGYWETQEGAQILQERLAEDEPVDVRANEILLQELAKGRVVIDSWSLPWLASEGTKIHLQACLEVRAQRVAKRSGISTAEAARLTERKDEDTRQLFKRLYDFDIKSDLDVFDVELDTDALTEQQVFETVCQALRSTHDS